MIPSISTTNKLSSFLQDRKKNIDSTGVTLFPCSNCVSDWRAISSLDVFFWGSFIRIGKQAFNSSDTRRRKWFLLSSLNEIEKSLFVFFNCPFSALALVCSRIPSLVSQQKCLDRYLNCLHCVFQQPRLIVSDSAH